MGVGKTTVGRALARQLGMEFADSDQEIEERTGVTISTIFDIEGEEGFRKREAAMLKELAARRNTVIATGGGIVILPENRDLMRADGTIVYLHASVDMQMERTRNSKNRPLLEKGDRQEVLEQLMAVREPLYRELADVVIVTDSRAPTVVAREIANQIRELWNQSSSI
jgi:shikimate kinase